ncbi:MAG: glycosyltransferase, partial [Phormidesmis sp.]
GRFVPEKGPHLAIQAALKAGYSIEIAGPISNKTYFEESVLPLIDQKQVKYLGHLSHSEVKQALKRASVFINTPMWEEPYGIVYAEALASGAPVATFNRGAAAEILTDRCGVVVKERTVEALARGVVEAAKLSRHDCRDRAESFCHIDAMVEGYERLYQKLIARQQHNERLARQEAIAVNVALASAKSPLNEMNIAS